MDVCKHNLKEWLIQKEGKHENSHRNQIIKLNIADWIIKLIKNGKSWATVIK